MSANSNPHLHYNDNNQNIYKSHLDQQPKSRKWEGDGKFILNILLKFKQIIKIKFN